MAILQEFDLEIQPMRLVRGQGLSKMIADNQDGNEKGFKFDSETNENDQNKMIVSQVHIGQGMVIDIWYQDIVYYPLQNQCPNWMNSSQHRGLKMKCESYMMQAKKLYKRNYEGIYIKCLGSEQAKEVLENFHDKYGIGHGLVEATTHMILRLGYFQPTIFRDTFEHVHSFHIFQTSAKRGRYPVMPLQLVYQVCPFTK